MTSSAPPLTEALQRLRPTEDIPVRRTGLWRESHAERDLEDLGARSLEAGGRPL